MLVAINHGHTLFSTYKCIVQIYNYVFQWVLHVYVAIWYILS